MAEAEGFQPLTDAELREFCKPGRWFPNVLDKRDTVIHQQSGEGTEGSTETGPGPAERESDKHAGRLKPIEVDNALLLLTRGLYNVKSAICTLLNAPSVVVSVWGFDMAVLTTSVGDTNGPPPSIALFREGFVAFPREINAALWVAPVGADIVIDVNHHDALTGTKTSLFGSQLLTIPAGSTTGRLKTFRSLRIKRYDLLSIDVDQVGSSTPGGYLEVSLEMDLKKLI